jgi:hypothetical protein
MNEKMKTGTLEFAFDTAGMAIGLLLRMLEERGERGSEAARVVASMTQDFDRARRLHNDDLL